MATTIEQTESEHQETISQPWQELMRHLSAWRNFGDIGERIKADQELAQIDQRERENYSDYDE